VSLSELWRGFCQCDGRPRLVVRAAIKSPRGNLYALDRNTGQQLWSFPPDAIVSDFSSTTPAVANGIVYFGVNRSGIGPVVYASTLRLGRKSGITLAR